MTPHQAPDIPASEDGYNLKLNINVVIPGTDDDGDPLALEYVRMYMRAYDHWLGGLVDAIYIDPDSVPDIRETPSSSEVLPWLLGARNDTMLMDSALQIPTPSASTSSELSPSPWMSRVPRAGAPPYRCVFPHNT